MTNHIEPTDPLNNLLAEIRRVYVNGTPNDVRIRPHLKTLVRAIDQGGTVQAPPPTRTGAVDRHLDTCLSLARQDGGAAIADAIEACIPHLMWRQSYHLYGRDPELEAFQSDYTFATVMAPEYRGQISLISNQTAMFGFTIQGPNTYYPTHEHKATELYYVIAGTAQWQRGDEGWITREPGSFILHDPWVPHAARTLDEPLLAMFAWVNDLDSTARLTEAG